MIILHRGKEGNLVQMPSDQVIQHGVSKELKPLIAVSEPVRIVGGMRKCLQKGFVFKKFSKAERNLEEEAFVAPDVANHVLKLVKPIQQVEQVLLWPGDSV